MSANEDHVWLYLANEFAWYSEARKLVKDETLNLDRATTRMLRILPERHFKTRFNRKCVRSYLANERREWLVFKAANPNAKD